MPKRKEKITTQERRFCRFYLECWNLGQAYMRAGYEPEEKNARQCAYQLFHKPHIQEYWKKILKDADEKELAQSRDIIVRLQQIANADLKDYMRWVGTVKIVVEGGECYLKGPEIEVFNSDDVDGTLITELTYSEKDGFKIKLESRMQALQLLSKIRGMVTEKVEHSGTIKTGPDLSNMTAEEIKAELDRIEAIEKGSEESAEA